MNKYPFELPMLSYEVTDLEDVVDAETVRIHHGKHTQTYVDNLNKLLADRGDLQGKTLEELLAVDVVGIKNNAGGVWNHTHYWGIMGKTDMSKMSAEQEEKIVASFGSVENFKIQFEQAGLTRFGSGWVWLVKDGSGTLEIISTPNQDNPLMLGKTPVLGNDVWEHTYYLKYQNRRGDYLKNWWRLVDWGKVSL